MTRAAVVSVFSNAGLAALIWFHPATAFWVQVVGTGVVLVSALILGPKGE